MGFLNKLFGKVSSLFKDMKRKSFNNFKINPPRRSYQQKQPIPYAQIAKEAYEPPNRRRNIPPYIYLGESSTPEIAVYANHDNRDMIVGFRGSETKKDIIPDIHIALGVEFASKRFRNSLKYFKNLKQRYPNYKFKVTGHSLGGAIANFIADEYPDVEGYTYNAGKGLKSNPLVELFKRKNKLTNVRTRGDLVSILNTGQSKTINGNNLNTHTIDNFV